MSRFAIKTPYLIVVLCLVIAIVVTILFQRTVGGRQLLATGANVRAALMSGIATDRIGGTITKRPVHFGEVHATMYKHFGIDPHATTVADFAGRPHYLVDEWKPLPEVV